MDGPTAIRMLKKINPQVKIVAVSGLASSDKVVAAMRTGVKAFFVEALHRSGIIEYNWVSQVCQTDRVTLIGILKNNLRLLGNNSKQTKLFSLLECLP